MAATGIKNDSIMIVRAAGGTKSYWNCSGNRVITNASAEK
jgi:hypothetical protein